MSAPKVHTEKAQTPDAGELPVVSRDDAEQTFRIDTSHGLTADFVQERLNLGRIYHAVQTLTTLAIKKGTIEAPTISEVYDAYVRDRRALGDRTSVSEDQARNLLYILVGQQTPFLYITRHLNVDDMGAVRVSSRYTCPLDNTNANIVRAMEDAVRRSYLVLKDLRRQSPLVADWSAIKEAADGGTLPERRTIAMDRADTLLAGLRLPGSGLEQPQKTYAQRANVAIGSHIIRPLLELAERSQSLHMVSCAEIRNQYAHYNSHNSLIYLAHAERLQTRLSRLRELLLSTGAAPHVDPQLQEDAALEFAGSGPGPRLEAFVEDTVRRCGENANLPAGLAEIALECMLLPAVTHLHEKQVQIRAELSDIDQAVTRIKAHGGLFLVYSNGNAKIKKDILRKVLSNQVPGVLACPHPFFPYKNEDDLSFYEAVYAVYQSPQCVKKAIESVVDLYNKNGDDHLLFAVQEMLALDKKSDEELKRFVPPVSLFQLRETLKQAYSRRLPFWSRLRLLLFSSEISPEKMDDIRREMRTEELSRATRRRHRQEGARRTEATKAVRKRAKELIRETGETGNRIREEDLTSFLDRSWEAGNYPTRAMVANSLGKDYANALENPGQLGVRSISIPNRESIFISDSYWKKNHGPLLAAFQKRATDAQAVMNQSYSNPTVLTAARKNFDFVQAILSALKG